MRVIWKYPLEAGENNIAVPKGAQFLHFDRQGGQGLIAWFAVDPTQNTSRVLLRYNVVGTGWEWDEGEWTYLATVANVGPFVWHLLQGEQ